MEIGDKIIIRDLFGSLTQDNSVLQVLSKIGEAAAITGTGNWNQNEGKLEWTVPQQIAKDTTIKLGVCYKKTRTYYKLLVFFPQLKHLDGLSKIPLLGCNILRFSNNCPEIDGLSLSRAGAVGDFKKEDIQKLLQDRIAIFDSTAFTALDPDGRKVLVRTCCSFLSVLNGWS